MRTAAINKFISANSTYPLIAPTKSTSPVVALIGIRDFERRKQHVAAVSVSGIDLLTPKHQREILRQRIKEATAALDRVIAQ